MLVDTIFTLSPFVAMFFARDCAACTHSERTTWHTHCTHRYSWVPTMHVTFWHLSSNTADCCSWAVCLTEQTWAELSTRAGSSLDDPIIIVLPSLFPASDWLCDWDNAIVIFACSIVRQLSYSYVSQHAAGRICFHYQEALTFGSRCDCTSVVSKHVDGSCFD